MNNKLKIFIEKSLTSEIMFGISKPKTVFHLHRHVLSIIAEVSIRPINFSSLQSFFSVYIKEIYGS
jgi:hypothetical protein